MPRIHAPRSFETRERLRAVASAAREATERDQGAGIVRRCGERARQQPLGLVQLEARKFEQSQRHERFHVPRLIREHCAQHRLGLLEAPKFAQIGGGLQLHAGTLRCGRRSSLEQGQRRYAVAAAARDARHCDEGVDVLRMALQQRAQHHFGLVNPTEVAQLLGALQLRRDGLGGRLSRTWAMRCEGSQILASVRAGLVQDSGQVTRATRLCARAATEKRPIFPSGTSLSALFSAERRNDLRNDPGPVATAVLAKNAHRRVPGRIGAAE